MDFEEKIDAMRTTLELAILDIEAQRTSMQEMRAAMQEMRVGMEEMRAGMEQTHASIRELRMLSEHHSESIQGLMKISGELVQAVMAHNKRIGAIEGRI